jgi:hypothetical protein
MITVRTTIVLTSLSTHPDTSLPPVSFGHPIARAKDIAISAVVSRHASIHQFSEAGINMRSHRYVLEGLSCPAGLTKSKDVTAPSIHPSFAGESSHA